MSKIDKYLDDMMHKRFGKDVRQSIHDSIYEINEIANGAKESATAAAASAQDSAEEALFYAGDCRNYAAVAVEYAEEAFSGTPEGYRQLVKDVHDQNVHFATGKEINVSTKKGGVRIDEVKGSAHKSANLLKPTLATTTKSGVTFTNNGNGTCTLNGTCTANDSISIQTLSVIEGHKYKLLGCPKNGSGSTYELRLFDRTNNNIDYGNGRTFIAPNTVSNAGVHIFVRVNTVFSNLVFKPMLIDLTENPELETATYDDYMPYGIHTAGGLGYVDLAEQSWNYDASNEYFWVDLQNDKIKMPSSASVNANIYCNVYSIANQGNFKQNNKSISLFFTRATSNGYASFIVRDLSYTNLNSFVSHLKKDKGVLAYELADGATPSAYALVTVEHGKNLLDMDKWNNLFDKQSDNSYYCNTINANKYLGFYLDSEKTYSIRLKAKGTATYIRISAYAEDGSQLTLFNFGSLTNEFVEKKGLLSFDKNIKALWINYSTNGELYIKDFQIEEGTEATDYTPYESKTVITPLKYPLASIGDVANTIDENGKHYPIACVDLSDINFIKSGNDGLFYSTAMTDKIKNGTENILCAKYKVDSTKSGRIDKTIYIGITGAIGFVDSEYANNTADDLKTLLKGVILYYETATTETEPLDESFYEVESFEGQTYIDTADTYAKATLSVAHGKSDTVATALNGERIAKKNEVVLEQKIEYLTNAIISMGGTV